MRFILDDDFGLVRRDCEAWTNHPLHYPLMNLLFVPRIFISNKQKRRRRSTPNCKDATALLAVVCAFRSIMAAW